MRYFVPISLIAFALIVGGCSGKRSKLPTVHCVTNTPQSEIEIASRNYLSSLQRLQAYEIKNKTYPKLFNVIPENEFIKYINDVVSSPYVNTYKFDTNITKIGKVDCFSEGEFAPIWYDYRVHLEIIDQKIYSDEYRYNTILNSLVRKYGDNNIVIDKKNRQKIVIKSKEKIFAIKNENSEWKFIPDSGHYRTLYAFIFPEDFLSKIQ
ncbi:MAG: hypothetical protein FNT15_06970 [Sulfurovum sp.]|nr:MAG: hypothetical protein FNT15_06970 [Sulfurovum sp.]